MRDARSLSLLVFDAKSGIEISTGHWVAVVYFVLLVEQIVCHYKNVKHFNWLR